MEQELPYIQDSNYIVSNLLDRLKLDENSPLYKAIISSSISTVPTRDGITLKHNGIELKYAQFTFWVDNKYLEVFKESIKPIMEICCSVLNHHGYTHGAEKPNIKIKPIDINDHLYKDEDFISNSGCYYRSELEVKIAKVLEDLGITFIANGRGRFQTGNNARTLEPDFVVFYQNKVAVLEVDGKGYHNDELYEIERDRVLMKAGFLFVKHYSGKECNNDPVSVVKDFLNKLESFT